MKCKILRILIGDDDRRGSSGYYKDHELLRVSTRTYVDVHDKSLLLKVKDSVYIDYSCGIFVATEEKNLH